MGQVSSRRSGMGTLGVDCSGTGQYALGEVTDDDVVMGLKVSASVVDVTVEFMD